MNKRILLSVMTIGVVLAMVGGATVAWFTDMERSTGNVLSAGVIDLKVDGENPLKGHQVKLDDLKPSKPQYYQWVTLSKTNKSNPGPVWMRLISLEGLGGLHPESEWDADPDDTKNDIYKWIDFDLCIDNNQNGVCDGNQYLIHPDDGMTLYDLRRVWIKIGDLGDDPIHLILSFHLRAETGNEYQGDKCLFDLEYLMQQDNAPPPGNRIILENKNSGSNWAPILGDGLWGIAEYNPGSLQLDVVAQGLPGDGRDLQIALNSPEVAPWYPVDETTRTAMASALAAHEYDGASPGSAPASGYNLYERAYFTQGALNTHGGAYVAGDVGIYAVATAHGQAVSTVANADSSGNLNWLGDADLPSGTYSYIKVLVKDDGPLWTTHLMEKDTPMFFTIP